MTRPIAPSYQFKATADLDDDALADVIKKTRRFFPDTYLDSPILIHSRLEYLAAIALPIPSTKRSVLQRLLLEVHNRAGDLSQFTIVDSEQYPELYNADWGTTMDDEFEMGKHVAGSLHRSVTQALTPLTGVTTHANPSPQLTSGSLEWMHRWSVLDSLVEEISRQLATKGPSVVSTQIPNLVSCHATKDMLWIDHCRLGKMMLTYDQVLMLKDVFFTRMQVMIACDVFYLGNPDYSRAARETMRWHESCLLRYRNAGFEILKNSEALAKAYLSMVSDSVFGEDGPYVRMLDKIRKKEIQLGTDNNFLADQFDRILRQYTDIQLITEIFGLLKVSGHPLIDARAGGKSAAEEARSDDQTTMESACRINWEFSRTMLESYVGRKGHWPPTLIFTDEGKRTQLYAFYMRQYRGLARGSYPLQDWKHCRWGQIVEFDYSPNYLDLIDDKAISTYRTNISSVWDKDTPMRSHRRLLMELISRGELDIKAIVTLIVKREVPFDWFIVSLHPKEREFKLAARMFSMLVLEMRIFFALTEANLADQIFPYLPQQTMTKDRLTIMRQFLHMTAPRQQSESLRMFLEIDLSRWNLRWRELTVHMVGRTLNDMFGTPGVFDFVHEFFKKAMIVVRVTGLRPSGIEEPQPPESDLLWYDHLGGFEGICQKLWTICTYSMIALALNDMDISYILVGQGDNQVVSMQTPQVPTQPPVETLSELRSTATSRIQEECTRVNQEVKPEECLESTSVVTYSKDVYVSGVYRPTCLKFHSRLFPHSSSSFPSVRTNIGAIFSTAMAGAEKSSNPLLSYYLACLYSTLYICRIAKNRGIYGHQMYVIKQNLKTRFVDWIRFLLTLPSELGGYPILPFVGFLYKGGSDPLGKSLSAMHLLARVPSSDRLFDRMLGQLDSDSVYDPSPAISTLFSDPFSAPFKKPVTSVDGVAQDTMDALRPAIRIREVKELVSADTQIYLDNICQVLAKIRPLNPLVIRDILDCSVAGVVETVSKMFVATRTLQSVVREMGIPVIDKVLNLECEGLLYLYQRFLTLPSKPCTQMSIYERTNSIRKRWFPQDTVCPIVGLTTYQPFDFPVDVSSTAFNREGVNGVLVADTDPLETRGPFDPYMGSMTREKRSEHGYKIAGTDSTSIAMRKLQLIISQTGDDLAFKSIIDAIGWSRTNTQLTLISDRLTGVKGGTLSHRYAARAGHQAAFNMGSPNFATHCVISTDNCGELSGGLVDYPIMFQEPALLSLWILQYRHIYSQIGNSGAVTIAMNSEGMDPLPDVELVGPPGVEIPVRRYVGNCLAFQDHLYLRRVAGLIRHPSIPSYEEICPSRNSRRYILESFFREQMRKNSMSRQVVDNSKRLFQVDTMDIAELSSNGVGLALQALTYVATDDAISNFMATDVMGRHRWRLDTYVMKLLPVLVESISPLIGHPLIGADPVVRRLQLYDLPRYYGSRSIQSDRLVAAALQRSILCLAGRDVEYNHRTVAVFSSTSDRATSELLLYALLSDIYVWSQTKLIPRRDVLQLVGREILPCLRGVHDESTRVAQLLYVADNAAKHYANHRPLVSQILDRYRGSNRIRGYKLATADALKLTRRWEVWGRVPIPLYTVPKVRPFKMNIEPRSRTCAHGVLRIGTRELDQSVNSISTRIKSWMYRNCGRYNSEGGTALNTWSPFFKILGQTAVIVIGSGNGAIAKVALDAGSPRVMGIDLRTTVPLRSHRFRHYKPPLVQMSSGADRYDQLPQTFTTSGDWMDPSVSQAVLDYDSGRYTVVIDIEGGERRYGLEVLKPVLSRKRHGLILCRLFLTSHECQQISSDLDASGCKFEVYDVEPLDTEGSRIFLLTNWQKELAVGTGCNHVYTTGQPAPRSLCLETDVDDNVTWSRATTDAILNVVMLGSDRSLEAVAAYLDRIILDTVGAYDTRHSYHEWTRLLRARYTIEWAMLPQPMLVETTVKLAERGTVTLVIQHKMFVLETPWSFIRHLCVTGSKLRVGDHEDMYRT